MLRPVRVLGLEAAMIAAGGLVLLLTALAWPGARAVDRETVTRAAALAGRIALLERTEIFEGASRPTLGGASAAASREEVADDTVVIREGEPADDLFIVESGTVRVTAVGARIAEEELRELGPGDHFSEIGLIERLPRRRRSPRRPTASWTGSPARTSSAR